MSFVRHPVAIGKLTGFLFGLAGFFALPVLIPGIEAHVQWGFLLWYLTFGAVVGVFGASPRPEFIPVPVPWWLRAPLVGAWLNFVLSLFAYQVAFFWGGDLLHSPQLFILMGAAVGLLVGIAVAVFGKSGAGGGQTTAGG